MVVLHDIHNGLLRHRQLLQWLIASDHLFTQGVWIWLLSESVHSV